jgi:hypothetical protein
MSQQVCKKDRFVLARVVCPMRGSKLDKRPNSLAKSGANILPPQKFPLLDEKLKLDI